VVDTLEARLKFVLVSSSELITQPVHLHFRWRIKLTHIVEAVDEDSDALLSLLEVSGNKLSVRSLSVSELLELRVSLGDPFSVPANMLGFDRWQQKPRQTVGCPHPSHMPSFRDKLWMPKLTEYEDVLGDPLRHGPLLGLSAHKFVDFFDWYIATPVCITLYGNLQERKSTWIRDVTLTVIYGVANSFSYSYSASANW
jgi:hypothetical protein